MNRRYERMQDIITKEAYSATQFGDAAIDIFGDGDTVRDVTTDKWWADCSILIFVAVDLICTPKGAIIGSDSRCLRVNFRAKAADFKFIRRCEGKGPGMSGP